MHALTIFAGSFLLFQVQPLIGRYLLPWFGGSPAVWTTCMLFFQVALLAGYGYAHAVTALPRRTQGWVHIVLLAAALLALPIAPDPPLWTHGTAAGPVAGILLLLTVSIGLPYAVLAANAPLLQHWFAGSCPGKSPYRLYALSNGASLLALLSYPVLIEPYLTLPAQTTLWGWLFVLYALGAAVCALARTPLAGTADALAPQAASSSRPATTTMLQWGLLSACGSALLLAATNQLCQEVAAVPFLWVLPLALYLGTFIVCFAQEGNYHRWLWAGLLVVTFAPVYRVLRLGSDFPLTVQAVIHLSALVVGCMVCHGELFRSRPAAHHLTGYYLVIAAGGALGGILVGVVAPLVCSDLWEYPIILAGIGAAVIGTWLQGGVFARAPRWVLPAALTAQGLLAGATISHIKALHPWTVAVERNFYGVLRVMHLNGDNGGQLNLMHGGIMHGSQYLAPQRRQQPSVYFGPESGAGLAFRHHPRRQAASPEQRRLQVGIIGLGAGTLAAYGESGDRFTFYEINPAVVKIAGEHFTFLKHGKAALEVLTGDARLLLAEELRRSAPRAFDLLIVDAFCGDAIPVHLLTRECFAIYRQHLAPDGLLLLHITNRHLDLGPVVRAQATAVGAEAALIVSRGDAALGTSPATWMIVTRNRPFLEQPAIRERLTAMAPGAPTIPWSDNYASLWPLLR